MPVYNINLVRVKSKWKTEIYLPTALSELRESYLPEVDSQRMERWSFQTTELMTYEVGRTRKFSGDKTRIYDEASSVTEGLWHGQSIS